MAELERTLVERLWASEKASALTNEAAREIELLEAGTREGEELLRDLDEYLSDVPDPADGGSHEVAELRQRIKRFLAHD